jgi:hypothetical protein
MPIRATGFDEGHAKHAMMTKRVFQHVAIPRLENVQRSNAWEHCARSGITGSCLAKSQRRHDAVFLEHMRIGEERI